MTRLIEWLRAHVWPPMFGVVTVLALFGLCLALLDNHFDDVQAARRVGRAERAVDSMAYLMQHGQPVMMPDGTIAWVAGPRDTTKGHDTVPVRYQGPRR